MAITQLAFADVEIAAGTLRQHLDQLWANGRPTLLGWERFELDRLHVLAKLPAKRANGHVDHFYFRLGAEYYDAAPPTVRLVQPDGQTLALPGSQWFPLFASTPLWFQLHATYPWPTGSGQLVCFSFTAEYYMTDHSPKESERWRQGRHTVAATLYRLAEVLSPPFYREPSA